MSSITYEELLREALVDLSEMQEQDIQSVGRKVGSKSKVKEDYAYFLQHWSAMYLRYLQIARKLEDVHDQLLQPQKRQDTRVLLDSCLGRMLEMKKRIVEFCGEYVNLDTALVDLKLTPSALEVPIPRYFTEERYEELNERRQYIEALIQHYRQSEVDAPVSVAYRTAATGGAVGTSSGAAKTAGVAAGSEGPGVGVNEPPMTLEDAVLLLQCNERGRQARQTAKFHRTIFQEELHQHREFEYTSTTGKDQAATRIQKIVLGYLARKEVKTMLRAELEFLGMEPSQSTISNAQRDRSRKVMVERKMRQAGNLAELNQEAKDLRAKIKVQEGGKTMEDMLDEILLHMANVQLAAAQAPKTAPLTGAAAPGDLLPTFPTEEEGGSLALLGRRPVKPGEAAEQKRLAAEAEAAEKKKGGGSGGQRSGAKKKGEEDEDMLPTIRPSVFWERFTEARERYSSTWHRRFEETYLDRKDFEQKYDKQLLKEGIVEGPGGTMEELRKCVDQLVMVEVANLRERMERERGIKRKKAKGKKAKKPPKVKDPSEGAKLETFISSAVYLNVLQLPDDKARVADYLGTHNMLESAMSEHLRQQAEQSDEVKAKWEKLMKNWNPYVEQSLGMTKEQFELLFRNRMNESGWMFEPSASQVRMAVSEYCVLPLGSQIIHDLVGNIVPAVASAPPALAANGTPLPPPLNNTVLLYGFAKSGKTMLTHSICNESGSNLFNLSPASFNPGTGVQKVIQLVFRLARALAPSVIYIDEVEKVFAGKGKKKGGKKGDPVAARAAKMKKDILNCMKELEPTDRVLVVGNSRAPWEGDFKEMTQFFKTMICCVHPDYASRLEIIQKLIHRRGIQLPTYNDYEILAHITNKYSSGTIAAVIEETLTDRRLKRVGQRPVLLEEFLPALSRATPIFKEEYALMQDFSAKLPMTLRRVCEDDFKVEEDPKDAKNRKPAPKGKK